MLWGIIGKVVGARRNPKLTLHPKPQTGKAVGAGHKLLQWIEKNSKVLYTVILQYRRYSRSLTFENFYRRCRQVQTALAKRSPGVCTFSKVVSMLALHMKCTRALTSENLC
jgi:hypothetical protein